MSEIALPPESPNEFNKQSAALLYKVASPTSPSNKSIQKQGKKEVNRSVYMSKDTSGRPVNQSE